MCPGPVTCLTTSPNGLYVLAGIAESIYLWEVRGEPKRGVALGCWVRPPTESSRTGGEFGGDPPHLPHSLSARFVPEDGGVAAFCFPELLRASPRGLPARGRSDLGV